MPNALDTPASWTWIYVESTGETAEQPVNFWTASWAAAHLHQVPSEGSSAELWIFCTVPGVGSGWRYVRHFHLDRPWLGSVVMEPWAQA